jgi:hypothetical protein
MTTASRVAYTFLVYMLSALPRRSVWAVSLGHPDVAACRQKGSSGIDGVHSRYAPVPSLCHQLVTGTKASAPSSRPSHSG